jgi:hypothetical protein
MLQCEVIQGLKLVECQWEDEVILANGFSEATGIDLE